MLHRCLRDAETAHVISRNPAAVEGSEIWRDFFYTELTTGLRRGEICGLIWQDFDEHAGTLTVEKQVYEIKGQLQLSVPKIKASIRRLVLPPGVVEVLREYRRGVDSCWIFPSPVKENTPALSRRGPPAAPAHSGTGRV